MSIFTSLFSKSQNARPSEGINNVWRHESQQRTHAQLHKPGEQRRKQAFSIIPRQIRRLTLRQS
jgi:hypothetical protein